MIAFTSGQGLVIAVVALAIVLVIVWGVTEAERDRLHRAHDRQLRREARRVKGEPE